MHIFKKFLSLINTYISYLLQDIILQICDDAMLKKIDTFYFEQFIWIVPNVLWFYCLQSGIIWQQVVSHTVSFLSGKQVKWFSKFIFHNKSKSIRDLCWKDSGENKWYKLKCRNCNFPFSFYYGMPFLSTFNFFSKSTHCGKRK